MFIAMHFHCRDFDVISNTSWLKYTADQSGCFVVLLQSRFPNRRHLVVITEGKSSYRVSLNLLCCGDQDFPYLHGSVKIFQ